MNGSNGVYIGGPSIARVGSHGTAMAMDAAKTVPAQMAPPPPRPELQEYLDRLGNVIDRVEHLASQVAERTNGVLRPPSPTGNGCEAEAAVPSTFYGQQVQNSIMRIAGVSARLQDLLDRLEA